MFGESLVQAQASGKLAHIPSELLPVLLRKCMAKWELSRAEEEVESISKEIGVDGDMAERYEQHVDLWLDGSCATLSKAPIWLSIKLILLNREPT
jgi:hypothetical protein